jgi:hypothetical protein
MAPALDRLIANVEASHIRPHQASDECEISQAPLEGPTLLKGPQQGQYGCLGKRADVKTLSLDFHRLSPCPY